MKFVLLYSAILNLVAMVINAIAIVSGSSTTANTVVMIICGFVCVICLIAYDETRIRESYSEDDKTSNT